MTAYSSKFDEVNPRQACGGWCLITSSHSRNEKDFSKENELCQQQDEQRDAPVGGHRADHQAGPMPGRLEGRHAGQPGDGKQYL